MTGVDLADARWFPVDFDTAGRNLHFLRIDESLIAQSAFIDNRLPVHGEALTPVQLADVAAAHLPPATPAWLWHTSFCGSTLLARLLHLAPHTVALREPLALRRLSDLRDAGGDVDAFLRPVIDLLARPWRPGGRVVIKPTHAALNIAAVLMDASPGSRGVVLTSSLDDFLVSHLKKMPETLSRIGLLAERALRAGRFVQRLNAAAFVPPSALAAAALQWAAQRELVAELRRGLGPERIRVLDWDTVQMDLPAAVRGCAQWLQLALPDEALNPHVALLAASHAKAQGRRYDVATRRSEIAYLRDQHAAELDAAMCWAHTHVLPSMRPDAIAI